MPEMLKCTEFMAEIEPDAKPGSFMLCRHGRLYRLKRKGWQPVRNPWLKWSIKRQLRKAMLERAFELALEACKAAAARDEQRNGPDPKLAPGWSRVANPEQYAANLNLDPEYLAALNNLPRELRDPDGFEVNRVVGRATLKAGEDIKAGDVVELDMENPPNADFRKDPEYAEALKEWKASKDANVVMEVPIERTESGSLEQSGPTKTTIEGHEISTLDQAEAVREFYQANYQRLKHEGKDTTRVEYMVGQLDKHIGIHFERIPLTKIDGTYLTEDEIRDAAAKLNLDVAIDVSAGSAKVDVITTPNAEPKQARGGVITDPPLPPGAISVQLSPGSVSLDAVAGEVMNAAADEIRRTGARGVWL
ncbi:hypothetical protein ArV1_064 [Arthrobacter phage vB_ArtM-ArV1]|uniref:Uncharacterized protein n=1 Tax=Arthrobacter phage vB_ArtM-ArV1 TaxID=1566993 RepID=A0A0A7HAQ0_9CAUD|nr:hypothetical protein ArV1_064 [Arthrobacter phage vB_ArtM-ArV1]AIZ01752.1 hypothetical protein ArV1_064 [Arthrobacter phage vB_ArtM-ArV1]